MAVLVVAALLGAGFVMLALMRPTVSLVTLVTLDVANLNTVIADQVGVSPYRPQLALAVLALAVLACRRRLRIAWSPVLLGLLVLLAACCLSLVQAADPAESLDAIAGRSRDAFHLLVVLTLVLSTRSVEVVIRAAVLVLAALAALTVLHEFVLHNTGDLYGLSRVPLAQEGGAATARHAGTSSDVNFWGRLLILFTPLSMALLAAARTWRPRLLWLGCVLSLLLGVYLTQSRGGFIALLVAVLCWLALAGGRYRRVILALPLVLAVVVPLSGIGSRLLTLATGSPAAADPSVVTRKRLQLDAWLMFLDRPVFGHGVGSYETQFPRFDRLSNAYQPVDIVVAAHNFYLEQAADGGVVLLLGWGVFVGTVLFAALRALTLSSVAADAGASARLLPVGVVAGVAGWSVASVFLHLSDLRALFVVAAVAAALDLRARAEAAPRTVDALAPRTPRRRLPTLAAVSGVATVAIAVVLVGQQPRYVNTATLAVVPASELANGSTAYQVDVVSRGEIVPTLTEVVRRSVVADDLQLSAPPAALRQPVSVDVRQSRLGGSVVVAVTGDTQDVAERAGAAAVTLGKAEVAQLGSSYQLSGTMSGVRREQRVPLWAAGPPAVLLLASLGMLIRRRRNG